MMNPLQGQIMPFLILQYGAQRIQSHINLVICQKGETQQSNENQFWRICSNERSI